MTTINPSTPFFKWKMAIVTKSTDDWTLWNCDENYERTLFIGIHDDLENPYAALYVIYKGKAQPAAGNAIIADLASMQVSINTALQELQALIDQVNATSASMQELWQKVNVLVAEMEDKLEDMQAQIYKAKVWAEGTDAEVSLQGGTHSSKTWAGIAKQAADLATGAAFPILAEGDQGKALVVNDSCDGYTLTQISASASDFSTNRIVHTATEEQRLNDMRFYDGRLVWLSQGVRGWFPNGHSSTPNNDADYSKLELVPYSVDFPTVLYNTTTEQHVNGIAAGEQPLRKYEGEGLIVFIVGYGNSAYDGYPHVIGFKYPDEITFGSYRDYTPPGQYHCRFSFWDGYVRYTVDGGQTWEVGSLPIGVGNFSWRGYYFMPTGSLVTTQWFYNRYTNYGRYWLVAPFEARIADGFMGAVAGGVNSVARATEVKYNSNTFYMLVNDGSSGFYGLEKKLMCVHLPSAKLGVVFNTAARVAYDGLRNRIISDDKDKAQIIIGSCPSETWWKKMNDTYSAPRFPSSTYPYFGVPPTFLANYEPTDVQPTEVVRCFASPGTSSSEYDGRGALANANPGTVIMSYDSGNSDALKVWKVNANSWYEPLNSMAGGTSWQSSCADISPASLAGQNTYAGRQNYNGYVNFYNTVYVQNTGAMNAMSAKYFLVPNPSLDSTNDRHILEAVNVSYLNSSLQGFEPANVSADLNPGGGGGSSGPDYSLWEKIGDVALDESTGIASGFSSTSYLKWKQDMGELELATATTADITICHTSSFSHYPFSVFSIADNSTQNQLANFGYNYSSYCINDTDISVQKQDGVRTFLRVIMGNGQAKLYRFYDADGTYTLDTLPELDTANPSNGWVTGNSYVTAEEIGFGVMQIGQHSEDTNKYADGTIDLKNSRITIGGTTLWDGSQGSTPAVTAATEGIHQQSALPVSGKPWLIRRFECDGHVFVEVDGMFSGTVATDNTIAIQLGSYGVSGTLYSVQAMPQGSGSVTVNYNSTSATDMANGKLTLRTSLAASETFNISLHLLVMQS